MLASNALLLVCCLPRGRPQAPAWSFPVASRLTLLPPFSPPVLNFPQSNSSPSSKPVALPPSPALCLPRPPVSLLSLFRRLRITAAPPREVCENAQCKSPGVPTPGAECEKRALHLMPDWPNLLPDSWAFLFPAARQERGQKWCGRRGEGTVIVSRSVEIPCPPTYSPLPPPPQHPLSSKPLLS